MKWIVTSDKFLTPHQVTDLINYLTDKRDLALARGNDTQAIRDYYILRTLLETGARVFEFCALTNADFHGHKVLIRHGKGNKPRTVLLTRATANMLKEWIALKNKLGFSSESTAPLFPSRYKLSYTTRGIQKRVKSTFAALNFPPNLSVHSLRHTYCSLLLESGKVGIATVKENLGHHSIAVTNLYAHAVGNLTDVELYKTASSEKTELCELEQQPAKKNLSDFVKPFGRKANFK